MAKLEIFEDNKTERFTGLAEAYLEPYQTEKMQLFTTKVYS